MSYEFISTEGKGRVALIALNRPKQLNPLAKAILEGRFAPRDTIRVDYRGGKMTFEKAPAKAAA